MKLDFSSLKKALVSLDNAISTTSGDRFINFDKVTQKTLIAGVIQNFEFTYELCWKFMRRYLAYQLGNAAVDGASRMELFRLAAEHQLIADVNSCRSYHEYRNLTSHVYDENVAEEIFTASIKFAIDAKKLLASLEAHND